MGKRSSPWVTGLLSLPMENLRTGNFPSTPIDNVTPQLPFQQPAANQAGFLRLKHPAKKIVVDSWPPFLPR